MERLTESAGLYFDPFIISTVRCKKGGGTARHNHPPGVPCHLTIVAAGSIDVEVFDDEGVLIRSYICAAPFVCDFNDGTERHHKITAREDGTVFYQLARTVTAREVIAKVFA